MTLRVFQQLKVPESDPYLFMPRGVFASLQRLEERTKNMNIAA